MSGPAREEQLARVHALALTPDAGRDLVADAATSARDMADQTPLPEGTPHVAVLFGGVRCLVPLAELRGVLTQPPKLVRFPFGPPWLLGIFIHRTELLALVDPLPVLFGRISRTTSGSGPRSAREDASRTAPGGAAPTILVGSGEGTLGFRTGGVSDVTFLAETSGTRSTAPLGASPELIETRYVAAMW